MLPTYTIGTDFVIQDSHLCLYNAEEFILVFHNGRIARVIYGSITCYMIQSIEPGRE